MIGVSEESTNWKDIYGTPNLNKLDQYICQEPTIYVEWMLLPSIKSLRKKGKRYNTSYNNNSTK